MLLFCIALNLINLENLYNDCIESTKKHQIFYVFSTNIRCRVLSLKKQQSHMNQLTRMVAYFKKAIQQGTTIHDIT